MDARTAASLELMQDSSHLVTTAPNSFRPPKETPVGETKSNQDLEGSLTFAFTPLSRLVANVPPEPEWLWEGYLAPSTVTILAGRPKVGKSTLVFGLLEAIGSGSDFLGRTVQQTGSVLLTEENVGTLAEKVERWGVGEVVHALTYHDAGGASWEVVVAEAVRYCHATGRRLLVVDTLAQWARLMGDSENDAGTALDQMRPLQAAAATGLAVLVVSHQRKSDGDHGEAIRGSNAIAGAVDVIVELERPRGLPSENLRAIKAVSRYTSTPAEVIVSLGEDGYHAEGDSLAVRVELERVRVVEAVTALPGSTADALTGELDSLPRATVSRHLKALHAEELVKRTGNGKRNDPYVWWPLGFVSPTPHPLGGQNELPFQGAES